MTAPLFAPLAIAVFLTLWRSEVSPSACRGVRFPVVAGVAVGVQAAHCAEELHAGFPERFPAVLDLPPVRPSLFVGLNLLWLVVWVGAIVLVRRGGPARVLATFPLWFLGLAAVLNGIAHPVLAIRAGGYFPGLVTAPLLAIAGILLLRELALLTSPVRAP